MQLDGAITALDRCFRIARDQDGIGIAHEARVSGKILPPRAAQQFCQRLARGLAGDVPQRDIKTRHRVHDGAGASQQMQFALQVEHQSGDVALVAAYRQGCN